MCQKAGFALGCAKMKETGQVEVPTQKVPDPPGKPLVPLGLQVSEFRADRVSRKAKPCYCFGVSSVSHLSVSTLAVSDCL